MLIEFPKEKAPVFQPKWYEKKGWQVAGGVLLVLAALWTARVGMEERGQLKGFFKLGAEMSKMRKGEDYDRQEVAKMLKTHPEMKPLLVPFLMHDYQMQGQAKEAVLLGEESLKRLSFIDPLYLQFAMTSILIEKGDFKNALTNSLDLESKSEGYPILQELNLKRIDFLKTFVCP